MAQRVALYDLLSLVAVDDGLEAFESPAAHDVANAFLLHAKSLDLIVDVEKERIVAGRVVARTN